MSTEIPQNVSSITQYVLTAESLEKYIVQPDMHVRRKSMFLWLIVTSSDENLK